MESNIQSPDHIAVIMDGNARWAKKRLLPASSGHKAGAKAIKNLVKSAAELNVKYLTIYAFSTENWQRPKQEVSYLMTLLQQYLSYDVRELIDNGVKILISGNLSKIDDKIVTQLQDLQEKTKNNDKICLNVAFDYGARQEICDAFKKIIVAIENKEISVADVSESLIANNFYQPQVPDPDLLIRTGGDMRISNFLLWQLAYSELYFTEKFWPDFNHEDLLQAITDFNKRQRNYGKRKS
jgi:undecaprenyl diphosphate synthase